MKKILFAIFLVALMAFAITGCKEDVKDEQAVSRPAGSAAAPSTSATDDCKFGTVEGCGPDDNICIYGQCWTEQELFDRFSNCDYTDGSAEECEAWSCEYCTSGKHSCYSTGSPRGSLDFCAECVKDGHCIEGMTCKNGICVGSPTGSAITPESEDTELAPVDVGSGDDILGKWDYGGFHYYFTEDGEISEVEIPEVRGTWEYVEGNDYIIRWNNRYSYVDDVTLSADRNTIEGIRRVREENVKLTRME